MGSLGWGDSSVVKDLYYSCPKPKFNYHSQHPHGRMREDAHKPGTLIWSLRVHTHGTYTQHRHTCMADRGEERESGV